MLCVPYVPMAYSAYSTTSTRVAAWLKAGRLAVPVSCSLHFSATNPWEVQLSVGSDQAAVLWAFDKSLLSDGLVFAAGLGAVCTWPGSLEGRDVLHVQLTSGQSTAVLSLSSGDILSFLDDVDDHLAGVDSAEFFDLDAEIRSLFLSEG